VSQYFSVTERERFLLLAQNLYQSTVERSANSNDGDEQLLYAELISFMAHTAMDPDARKYLLDLAHAFTGFKSVRKEDALSSDLYHPALLVAVQDSDADFLHYLIEFRVGLDDPLFASASADAIGRISNPDLLGDVRELALGGSLESREVFGLVSQALTEPALRDQHWLWFRENFATVADKIPTQWRRFMPGMATQFCDQFKLDELKDLFEQNGDLLAGYQRNLDQAEERIQLCIAQRGLGEKLVGAVSAR
jgi:alanyl aminopeptidase